MRHTVTINGVAVKLVVDQSDVDDILELCANDPHAVAAYADSIHRQMPALRRQHETERPRLVAYWLRRSLAADMAVMQVAAVSEGSVVA